MAVRQPLKGRRGKEYALISNFDKGYNTKYADDVMVDSQFRYMENMTLDKTGVVSKRPAFNDVKLSEILKHSNMGYTFTNGLKNNANNCKGYRNNTELSQDDYNLNIELDKELLQLSKSGLFDLVVGEDLSGQTLYTSFPNILPNGYLEIFGGMSITILETDEGNSIVYNQIYASLGGGLYNHNEEITVYDANTGGSVNIYERNWDPDTSTYEVIKKDIYNFKDNFGTVTSIVEDWSYKQDIMPDIFEYLQIGESNYFIDLSEGETIASVNYSFNDLLYFGVLDQSNRFFDKIKPDFLDISTYDYYLSGEDWQVLELKLNNIEDDGEAWTSTSTLNFDNTYESPTEEFVGYEGLESGFYLLNKSDVIYCSEATTDSVNNQIVMTFTSTIHEKPTTLHKYTGDGTYEPTVPGPKDVLPFEDGDYCNLLFVFGGEVHSYNYENADAGYKIIKVKIEYTDDKSVSGYNDGYFLPNLETTAGFKYTYEVIRPDSDYDLCLMPKGILDKKYIKPATFGNSFYFKFKDVIKVSKNVGDTTEISEAESIEILTPHKPEALEIMNIGFNIMADSPLEYIETGTGSADAIRGVFYTVEGEPVQKIPFNKQFKIHILTNGTGVLATPTYRPNNGEYDETANPYTALSGAWDAEDDSIFICSGLNQDGDFEFYFEKGAVDFRSYVSTGSTANLETGKINDIKELIDKSLYCTVINGQLVLYGGHPYIFFSDFEKFSYYPNYFNIYATDEAGDEATHIQYFRQYYAVFTKKRIKRLTGSFGTSDFGLFPLSDFIGCPFPHTIKQVENNLVFLSTDGLYRLKQGYTGEGTENVEKIDENIDQDYMYETDKDTNYLPVNAKVIGSSYYLIGQEYKQRPTGGIVQTTKPCNFILKYDVKLDAYIKHNLMVEVPYQKEGYVHGTQPTEVGALYLLSRQQLEEIQHISPMFGGDIQQDIIVYYNSVDKDLKLYRYTTNDFGSETNYYKSVIKTPKLHLGYPTNDKKFKEVYFKIQNPHKLPIALYLTVLVDGVVVFSPQHYVAKVSETHDYVYYEVVNDSTFSLEVKDASVLGEFELGDDVLGRPDLEVVKLRLNAKGKSIQFILEDNYGLNLNEDNEPFTHGDTVINTNPFSLNSIGIQYRLKKVRED